MPPAEHVHWLFATGILFLGLCLLAEALVGRTAWRRRRWRAYLWPSVLFALGVCMWPVTVFYTNSTIHLLAHAAWAQALMAAGATQLLLASGVLRNRYWNLTLPLAMLVSGAAFLLHEQNPWLYARSAFLHHALGWTLVGAALFPLVGTFRPRADVWRAGFALAVVAMAVMLYTDRDAAPIFGHFSPLAGKPHR